MQILRVTLVLAMAVFAVLYWKGTRPKQQIDLTGGASTVVSKVADQTRIEELDNLAPKNFKLKDLQGNEIELESLRGKPILLHFWATWCPPCIAEMPELLKFAQSASQQIGLKVLAISVDENVEVINQFFREKKFWPNSSLPLTILNNSDLSVAELYGTMGYPETFFIDRNFRLVRKYIGPQKWGSEENMQWIKTHAK